jgi:hypothetical protein
MHHKTDVLNKKDNLQQNFPYGVLRIRERD